MTFVCLGVRNKPCPGAGRIQCSFEGEVGLEFEADFAAFRAYGLLGLSDVKSRNIALNEGNFLDGSTRSYDQSGNARILAVGCGGDYLDLGITCLTLIRRNEAPVGSLLERSCPGGSRVEFDENINFLGSFHRNGNLIGSGDLRFRDRFFASHC